MYKFPLETDTFLILAPRWAELGPLGQNGLLALLLFVPAILILWLCRNELHVISRWNAFGLMSLRMVVLAVLWTVIGLQPHVAEVRIEETPGRVRIAVDLSASMDVIDGQSTPAEKNELTRVLNLASVDEMPTRKAIVGKILGANGLNLIQRLKDRHEVEIVGFHHQATELSATQLLDGLAGQEKPETTMTDLNLPLAKVMSTREQPLLGVLLFSDGQHNVGTMPLGRAEELGKQQIPVFPIVIGSKEKPRDVRILEVRAPSKVFRGMTAPVEIRVQVTNVPAQNVTVEMQFDGRPVLLEHRHIIQHKGADDIYFVRFQSKMDDVGTRTLSVRVKGQDGLEASLANNAATRYLRVLEDKVKVLLVDGEARWEYHYLANALSRDPAVKLERVVFSQPRLGLLKNDELEKAGLPKSKLPEPKTGDNFDPLLDYDCILLGDVSPEQLPIPDRIRLEKYVSERGGTLVLIAGKRWLPMAYTPLNQDPLAKMLPISEVNEWQKEAGFALRVTSDGRLHPFLNLSEDAKADAWPELPKHFWGVVGKRKPGATVLVAPSPSEDLDTGIIVQQNYGAGRALFVGLDSTWRWRFRVGDTYHHRFWGQLVRGAAEPLPAGNRHLRYGSREPAYMVGDDIEIAARLRATLPPLKDLTQARAKLYRKNAVGGNDVVAVVPLIKNPRQPNLLEAKMRDLTPGTYRVELDIPQYREQLAEPPDDKDAAPKGSEVFHVMPREDKELQDLSTNWSLMQSLADRSGGTLYTPADVEAIVNLLARKIERHEFRDESKPWQDAPMVWWLLGILLSLLTIEWLWRKAVELP